MTSNNVDNIVDTLQNKVNTIVTKNNSSTIKHIIPVQQSSININPYIYYAAIPIVLIIIIIIILYILKPKFIMDKQKDDNYRINFKKMIITVVILCGIIGGSIIGWKYYKKM
jgi:hypothetical protein